ncbi:MAG: S-layer homology domain-containing protein [Candidatus Ornithomonoglobus sp.]
MSVDVYVLYGRGGAFEVYNADGEMADAKVIDKCEFETSISDTFGTMFNIGKDIWNGVYNPMSYKSSIQSKKTTIPNLTIPCGGYLKITPDTRESAVCGAANGLDIIGQVMSLSGDVIDASSIKNKKDNIAKTVTEKIKDGGKKFTEAYGKGMTTEISNRTLASRSDAKEFIGAINDMFSQGVMKELAVSVFTDSAVDLGKSTAEEWFAKNSGPAGKALEGFFKFSEVDNLIMQAVDFVKKANKGGIIIQAPDGSTRRCSDVTVNCKMNDNTALDVYRLDKNSLEIMQAKNANPGKLGSSIEGYNITLSENGEERQPEGKAEVTIDIPSYMSGGDNISVYRLEKDGGITDMKGKVSENTVTFETDHFSAYLLTADGTETELTELKEGQTVINGDTIVSDWAAEEVQEAFDENLVPDVLRGADLTEKIDRAEFAAIAVTLYEKLSAKTAQAGENPFGDIAGSVCKDDILKAYNLGITNGITDTRFEPSTLISREQVATMLTRAYKKSEFPDWTLATDGDYPLNYMGVTKYADDDEISDYAKESVYFMTRWDILNGVDDSHFAPKNNTTIGESYGYATREQAVVIALRSAKHL